MTQEEVEELQHIVDVEMDKHRKERGKVQHNIVERVTQVSCIRVATTISQGKGCPQK